MPPRQEGGSKKLKNVLTYYMNGPFHFCLPTKWTSKNSCWANLLKIVDRINRKMGIFCLSKFSLWCYLWMSPSCKIATLVLLRAWLSHTDPRTTDTQRELFFKNPKLLGLGQKCLGNFRYFRPNYSTHFGTVSPLSMALSISLVFFSTEKLLFLGLKQATPKYLTNIIMAVKNLRNSHHTSVVGAQIDSLPSFS